MFLNTYLGHVGLVLPNVLGPIEHLTTPGDYSKVPLYITFPLHRPSCNTLSAYSPQTTINCGTSAFLPCLGEGQVLEVIELTTTATIVVIPKGISGRCGTYLCPAIANPKLTCQASKCLGKRKVRFIAPGNGVAFACKRQSAFNCKHIVIPSALLVLPGDSGRIGGSLG